MASIQEHYVGEELVRNYLLEYFDKYDSNAWKARNDLFGE
jgi:hypothetical protein